MGLPKFLKPTPAGQMSNANIQRGQAQARQAIADRAKLAKVRAPRAAKTERAANREKN